MTSSSAEGPSSPIRRPMACPRWIGITCISVLTVLALRRPGMAVGPQPRRTCFFPPIITSVISVWHLQWRRAFLVAQPHRLCRRRLSQADTPTTVETSIMQMAQARGARVWSAPWTPAAGFKSVNDIYDSDMATAGGINGGSFLGGDATNQAYASQLANYVAQHEKHLRRQSLRHLHPKRAGCECDHLRSLPMDRGADSRFCHQPLQRAGGQRRGFH